MGSAFDSIKQGLLEAIVHAAGQPSTAQVHTRPSLNVRAIRKHIGMTQTAFAAAFGISVNTLRHWERGDRIPRGPARVLLRVVATAPRVVLDALAMPEPSEEPSTPRAETLHNLQQADGVTPRSSASPTKHLQRTVGGARGEVPVQTSSSAPDRH